MRAVLSGTVIWEDSLKLIVSFSLSSVRNMFKKLCPLSHIRMYGVNVSVTVLYTVRRLSTYNLQYIHTYVRMWDLVRKEGNRI